MIMFWRCWCTDPSEQNNSRQKR